MAKKALLSIRLLGEFEILRGSTQAELPQSRKTRALLAYLIVTERSHRRERLCSLLWDVTDDPRGALRWSLSKLRTLVDDPGRPRIVADRESVAFDAEDLEIDLCAVGSLLSKGLDNVSTDDLRDAVRMFRGEFLEGLDLPDFHEFQSWCISEREQARRAHVRFLNELVERLGARPDEALAYGRALVKVDPLSESAHARLIRLLSAAGRRAEAELQYAAAARMLRELGAPPAGELQQAWKSVRGRVVKPEAPLQEEPPPETYTTAPLAEQPPLVGRKPEMDRLLSLLEQVATRRRAHVLLLTGEPGVGKTRLMAELTAAVRGRGGTVLEASAYEAETRRPYGPWVDALRRVPAFSIGKTIGSDLAPLLPELPHDTPAGPSRERLFGAVAEFIAARAHIAAPVLLAFDDVHWCDEASVELLHYVIRMERHRPVIVALAARSVDLPDNVPMHRALHWLRRDGLMEEVRIGPLTREDTCRLVHTVAPGTDAGRVFSLSGGNPLFALEAARSLTDTIDGMPASLAHLVRERVDRIDPVTVEVLRWCAVLGPIISVRRLSELMSAAPDELVSALEKLERHAVLRDAPKDPNPRGDYVFVHDLVRQVVYGEISEPRRLLMHRRVAQSLENAGGSREWVAAEIARHAALSGDAGMAAQGCVRAGRHCLRVFANKEAASFTRRGFQHAERLQDPERVQREIELTEIMIAALPPDRSEASARSIMNMAERALDHGCHEHARLGFHLLGVLNWEKGHSSEAERQILRAEQVSRGADEKDRIVAMAEASRCLTLLERDLALAEALVLQAGVLCTRLDIRPSCIPDAEGVLRLHEGNLDEAELLFEQARLLARTEGSRFAEFQALEHLAMVELQKKNFDRAAALGDELVKLGEKLREGSEAPFSRALATLARYARIEDPVSADLDRAIDQVRLADAKFRLAYILTRAAELDLAQGRPRAARDRALEALAAARRLQRPSEIALALVLLARSERALRNGGAARRHLDELREMSLVGVSRYVQQEVRSLLEPKSRTAGS
jgi:DNA-binding SARP family transcriptional activator